MKRFWSPLGTGTRLLIVGLLWMFAVCPHQQGVLAAGGHAVAEDDEEDSAPTSSSGKEPDSGNDASSTKNSGPSSTKKKTSKSKSSSQSAYNSAQSNAPWWTPYLRHPLVYMMWVYFFIFMIGKWYNGRQAKGILNEVQPTFKQHFDTLSPIEQREYNLFEQKGIPYRKSISIVNVHVEMCRRHDPSYYFSKWFFPENDRMRMEFEMPNLEPFCTVFFRKGNPYRSQHRDIRECKIRKVDDLGTDYVCMSDTTEGLTPLVEEGQIQRIFEQSDGMLDRVHVSGRYIRYDIWNPDKPKGCLVVDFKVDSSHTAKAVGRVIALILQLIDVADRIKIPEKTRSVLQQQLESAATSGGRGETSRKSLDKSGDEGGDDGGTTSLVKGSGKTHEEWQKAARQRKIEKEKEQREKLAKMTPAEQAKWEEREKKRDMKSRMSAKGKMKMVMK